MSAIKIRKSSERGSGDHGWLNSQHTFSFAQYHDPKHMGFRSLRVINEDRIRGGTGFGAHPHRDMEIISYVVSGALSHQDSMGTTAVIKPGEVQRMSAGTGVVHSEKNELSDQAAHFFQIWILPSSNGGAPSYGQKSFETQLNEKNLVLVISGDARDGSIGIKQNTDMYISRLKMSDRLDYKIRSGRGIWIQVIKGLVQLDLENEHQQVSKGDGVQIELEHAEFGTCRITALESSELMIFDMA